MPGVTDTKYNYYVPLSLNLIVSENDKVSKSIDLWGATARYLLIPNGLASTSITFQGSLDGENFFDITSSEDGNPVTITVTSSETLFNLNPIYFQNLRFLRIVTGSAESSNKVFIIQPSLI